MFDEIGDATPDKPSATCSDAAARLALVPSFTGQLMVQLDEKILWRGSALTAGSWEVADGRAPSRPTTAAGVNAAIAAGAAYVGLQNVSIFDERVVIPNDVTWDPPIEGNPIDCTTAVDIFEPNGPCSSAPGYQLFTNYGADSVRGAWGSRDVLAVWWLGGDWAGTADASAGIQAAINSTYALTEGAAVNAATTMIDYNSTTRSGDVRVPPGLWTCATEITCQNKYTRLRGYGDRTFIRFAGVKSGHGFVFHEACPRSGIYMPLTAAVNEVATVGSANDAVTLPPAQAGRPCTIVNNGANTLEIWPASGDDLGAGVDTATTLAAGGKITFSAYDTTHWMITA